jgi:hypothetical protein
MYIFTLVDDVRNVLEKLRAEHGEFTLAMLYNTGSLQAGSSWNLIVSASWTDMLGLGDATHLVADALGKGLESQDKAAISRVTVLKTSDQFVRDMTKLYPVSAPGGAPLHQVTAGQITEGSAFVLYSQRAA